MAQTAGVKPMTITGRMASQRERCLGMNDSERAWRKQWLQDQILAPNEPVYVEEYWKERLNPIRRFYRAPLDMIFNPIKGFLGEERAFTYRYITGKLFLIGFGILGVHYYFKYNGNDWTKKGGWRVMTTKPKVLPGQAGFPFKSDRTTPQDYADRGFRQSAIYPK